MGTLAAMLRSTVVDGVEVADAVGVASPEVEGDDDVGLLAIAVSLPGDGMFVDSVPDEVAALTLAEGDSAGVGSTMPFAVVGRTCA